RGTRTANPEAAPATNDQPAGTGPADDPATSPYPIWRSTAAYGTGYKVVWQHEIYEANWWTQGTAPDAGGSTTEPWQPIGPVPAGSRAPKLELLATGAF